MSVSNPTAVGNSSDGGGVGSKRSLGQEPERGPSAAWQDATEGAQAWNRGRERERGQNGGADGFRTPLGGGVDRSTRGQQFLGAFLKGGAGGQREGELGGAPNESIGDVGVGSESRSKVEPRTNVGGYELNPREIYRKLSEHVIGQVERKREFCKGARQLWWSTFRLCSFSMQSPF